jgi:DNA-binding protein H-NS
MNWLTIKAWLSKAKVWCKVHWELLLGLLIGLIVLVVFRRGTPDFSSLYRQLMERQKEQVDVIDALHQKEVKLQEEAAQRALDAMKQVETDYESRSEALDKKKRREVQKVIEESKNDPDDLARRLAELTGATFVPRGE